MGPHTRYLLSICCLLGPSWTFAIDSVEATSIEVARDFWSYQPLSNIHPPQVVNHEWVRTPIDRFILAHLEQQGITCGELTDPATLIRRAYFDLLGLPPPSEVLPTFSGQAAHHLDLSYRHLVDRLLASNHYGERWARHWLDVTRFAESDGFEQDKDRPGAYHYRDFLIKAFNENMAYNQFVRWQIAGDQLAPEELMACTATGFLVAGSENVVQTKKEFERDRYDKLDDMASTVGTAMLGLTIGCARCHDHKYDPISQQDYYSLVSTFKKTVGKSLALSDGENPPQTYHAIDLGTSELIVSLENENFTLEPKVYFLHRGMADEKGDVVSQGFPQILMRGQKESYWGTDSGDIPSRVALANWITDIPHGAGPLLSRVMVNRVWHHHFGRGLVETPTDFGNRGGRPSHPQLLDWLASYFVRSGWRVKSLHRLIMTSSVYMQRYRTDTIATQKDPDNRLLWRRSLRRLESEAIRDTMISVSGVLDPMMYGPGSLDESSPRRSIYLTIKRSKLLSVMQLFDAPDALQCVGCRQTTTVAPQALMLMNHKRVHRYANSLAARIARECKHHWDDYVGRGFEIALSRKPSDDEQIKMETFINRRLKSYLLADTDTNARKRALADFCHLLICLNEFIYVE